MPERPSFEDVWTQSKKLYAQTAPVFDDVDPRVTMIVLAHMFAAWLMTQADENVNRAVELFHQTSNEIYDEMCDLLEAEEGTLQ